MGTRANLLRRLSDHDHYDYDHDDSYGGPDHDGRSRLASLNCCDQKDTL